MHRLKDFYYSEIRRETQGANLQLFKYESYSEWLERIGVNETDDDKGMYGDEEVSWEATPPLIEYIGI